MVVSTITSGLGNQLFQYAIARHISFLQKSPLYFDLRFYMSEYSRETNRSFKLDKFCIPYTEISRSTEYLIKCTKLLPSHSFSPFFTTAVEKYYHYDPNVLETQSLFLNLKGYWHSERYFHAINHIIRSELKFSNQPCLGFYPSKNEIQNSQNSVSLHLRRGDYVHHPEFSEVFGFVGLEYYTKAIDLMQSKVKDCKFFIFTDDVEWVTNNFTFAISFTIVCNSGPDADLDDLHLMSLCNHNIIANSSFSW